MRQNLFYFSIVSLILLCACGSPTPPPIVSPLPTITEVPTLTPSALIVVTAYPTLHATQAPTAIRLQPTATSIPIATPTMPAPKFSSDIYFSANEPNQSEVSEVFPRGTQQIFAMWDYSNMVEGSVIRRDWYHDGELWLRREEPWDLDRWGTDGTVRDISVYDFESGLEPGLYRLELYIDGKAQFSDDIYDDQIWFQIAEEPSFTFHTSPDGTYTVSVIPPGKLMIESLNGQRDELVKTDEISSVAWFPDSQHLLYGSRDRRNQERGGPWFGVQHELWVIDILTGKQHLIGTSDENLHTPVISPNGHYVAALMGTGFADACHGGHGLWVIELDEKFNKKTLHEIADFSWSAINLEGWAMYLTSTPDISIPGIWQTDTQLTVGLDWMCTFPNPRGIYRFDITTLAVEKISELERP